MDLELNGVLSAEFAVKGKRPSGTDVARGPGDTARHPVAGRRSQEGGQGSAHAAQQVRHPGLHRAMDHLGQAGRRVGVLVDQFQQHVGAPGLGLRDEEQVRLLPLPRGNRVTVDRVLKQGMCRLLPVVTKAQHPPDFRVGESLLDFVAAAEVLVDHVGAVGLTGM